MPKSPVRIRPEAPALAPSSWLSPFPAKREFEKIYLKASLCWILIFGTVVVSEVYTRFGDLEYILLGLVVVLPYFVLPLYYGPKGEYYWLKTHVWMFPFTVWASWFWTHGYFFTVLKCSYHFPNITWQLRGVPVALWFFTHSYFLFYHTCSTILLRKLWQVARGNLTLVVPAGLLLCWITAFLEAFTISIAPVYKYPDAYIMYTIGSVFYGLYFVVSYPLFAMIDESSFWTKGPLRAGRWSFRRCFLEGLAASALVHILLDLWAESLGDVYSLSRA